MVRYLIGADIGTQGTKAAVYRPDGTCLADSFEPSVLLHPEEGSTTQDPEQMLGSVLRTVRDAVQKAGIAPQDVAAIGLDAQMSGILGVAADGMASTPYDSWLDTRCTPYVQRMKQTAEDEIVRRTGASTATISRVNRSLEYGCDAYPMVFSRLPADLPLPGEQEEK